MPIRWKQRTARKAKQPHEAYGRCRRTARPSPTKSMASFRMGGPFITFSFMTGSRGPWVDHLLYRKEEMSTAKIPLLASVALTVDVPDKGLTRGEKGDGCGVS